MLIRFLRGASVPLLLIGMLVLAGVTADRVYSGNLLTLLVAGAAVASVGLSLLFSRLPAWAVAPLSTVGLAGYLAFALWYSARQAAIPGGLATIAVETLRDGIPRLLAALVPMEAQPDTVAVPVVATWLAGLATTELAVRARRTTAALALPVLLYSGALWLAGPVKGIALWPTLAFGALAVTALAITGRVKTPESGVDAPTRNALRLRTAVAAAVGVALILAVTVAGGPALSRQVTQKPLDPRSLVDPPKLDALDENPLIRLSGWALEPKQKLLDVKVPKDTKIRLAVLSDYDGVTWRVGATYRPAGRTLPELPAVFPREPVRQEITVAGLTGKLLPAVATPRQIDGVRVAFDQATGTVIQAEGLREGMRYTVVSQQERPDYNDLPGADVPNAAAMGRYLALDPGFTNATQGLAQKLANDNGAPYQRALALERYLSEHYRLDPQAPSGHAYPNLDFFLFSPVVAGGQKGTSEQFAAAFAVLARLMNLPSRVVVGFQARHDNPAVTAGDALAWPEVYFTGVGWVAFNPLPQADQRPKPPEQEFKPKPDESDPPPSEAPIPTLEPTRAGPQHGAIPTLGGNDSQLVLVAGAGGGGLILLILLLFVLIVLIGRSRLRRRRLEAGSPAHRVEGAWLEISDALRLAGRRAPDHLTAEEVSAYAALAAARIRGKHTVRLAAPPLDELAEVVNRGAFSAEESDDQQAEIARVRALSYIGELKARRSWWRRLIWTLHPGPLRWRRRR
jgi:Transglutaminase-like superfamily/TgpA N-terminal domain